MMMWKAFLLGGFILGMSVLAADINSRDAAAFAELNSRMDGLAESITQIKSNTVTNVQQRNDFMQMIMTKDEQADKMTEILSDYFLQERLQPDELSVDLKLKGIYQAMVFLREIQQTADPDSEVVEDLKEELVALQKLYQDNSQFITNNSQLTTDNSQLSVTAKAIQTVSVVAPKVQKVAEPVEMKPIPEVAEISPPPPVSQDVPLHLFTDPTHVGCPICGEKEGHQAIADYFLAEEEALLDAAEGISME